MTFSVRAGWVFPITRPPLARGVLTIEGERIASIEPDTGQRVDVDAPHWALLPGLVNAHTHLDLSGLRGLLPPGPDFPDWLQGVIGHRRQRTDEQVQQDIAAGITESLTFGTTLVGDISAGGTSWAQLASSPLRAVVHYELLGLPRSRAALAWAGFLEWLRAHPATPTCRPGVSPHAPYSVRRSLFQASGRLAHHQGLPLSVHLAETRGELQLLREHAGSFRAFLERVGVWDAEGLCTCVDDVLAALGASTRPLLIHGNYLDSREAQAVSTVVYCPRTHAAFGHRMHPLPALLAEGVRVALGTDSLASNPDLDVLAEGRLVRRLFPGVSGAAILRMMTLSGAEALGWDREVGSLEPGKSADCVLIELAQATSDEAHELVLQGKQPIGRVLLRGRWVR